MQNPGFTRNGRRLSLLAKKPIKMTLPGPMTIIGSTMSKFLDLVNFTIVCKTFVGNLTLVNGLITVDTV